MSARKETLTEDDHVLLAMLIRGHDSDYICDALGIGRSAFGLRVSRMRRVTGARSTYQLIAMEMLALVEVSDAEKVRGLIARGPACERRGMAKGAAA